jgi:hypothetical protein
MYFNHHKTSQFKSVLKYYPLKNHLVCSTVRWMVVDEVADRYWLIHDSDTWFEGLKKDKELIFNMLFCG